MALPKPETNPAAAEGTVAHKWCEKVLLGEAELDDVEDDTMRAGVEVYTTYAEEVFEKYHDPGYEVEGKVELGHLIPGGSPPYWSCFGSADFFIYENAMAKDMPEGMKYQIPEVIDFKYGRHAVEIVDNTQLMLYANGLAEDIGHRGSVKITVVQPRAAHADGPVRSHIVTGKELRDLVIRARSVLSKAHKAIKVAGDHCFYCQLATDCEVKNKQIQKTASMEFAEDVFKPISKDAMSDEQIALIVKNHKAITKWMEGVVAAANVRSRGGKPIDGTKLVRNPGRNAWTDDATFAKMAIDLDIVDEAYKTAPKGIGDIKAILKEHYDNNPDDLIAEYVTKSEGSVSLVSDDDGRLEYNSAALDFAGK